MFARRAHEDVGLNVLKYRRQKNMTQEQLADDAGISRARLSAIECGTSSCLFSTLMKIAKALDIPPSLLLKTDATISDLTED